MEEQKQEHQSNKVDESCETEINVKAFDRLQDHIKEQKNELNRLKIEIQITLQEFCKKV